MTPPDAHQAPARSDKTEDWDARHAQSRTIEKQADGSFKAVDKVPSAPATARVRDRLIKQALDEARAKVREIEAACPSLAAPASAASFRDGVEAAAKVADKFADENVLAAARYNDDEDYDACEEQELLASNSGRIAKAIRALTPPAASQDSGADFPKCREPARDVREIVTDIAATGGEPSGEIVQGVAGLLADIGKLRLDLTAERERSHRLERELADLRHSTGRGA